ncbi:MAG: hypothetical protein MK085_04300 [Phycisphaerales bacterium]|nr:hypothetical protein [Phycisphaerales bacterium]
MNRLTVAVCLMLNLCVVCATAEEIEIDSHIGSHMVLQADKTFLVSGTAAPGITLDIIYEGSSPSIWMKTNPTVGKSGRWSARLEAGPATISPRTLTVKNANQQVVLDDILVGEVWLCSGQSNMVWRMRSSDRFEEFKADADHPTIRTFNANNTVSETPRDELGGRWLVCSPETIGDFSAVAYHFGRALSDQLNVPIGLYNVSWGGSRAEAWMSPLKLELTKGGQRAIDQWSALKEQMNADPGPMVGIDADDSGWIAGEVPGRLDTFGIDDGVDGIFWERIPVEIPAEWAGSDLVMSLGAIDDHDTTWFNGTEIGSTRGWETPRKYTVPGALVKPGKGMIAVRIIDGSGPGGLHGEPEAFFMHPVGKPDDRRPINGPARVMVASNVSEMPNQHRPSQLFYGMLHPLFETSFAGVIWYQGENNAMGPGSAEEYAELLPALIEDWRSFSHVGSIGQKNMPFYVVQLANLDYRVPDWDFPLVRDIQRRALELPNTGLAVTTDIGDARDIHPRNKHDVGDRLARWALADVYGNNAIVKSGPLVSNASLDRGGVVVEFDTFGSPLMSTDGQATLGGFEVARGDGPFVPVSATISSNRSVRVGIPEGKGMPRKLRYAWRPDPTEANLGNEEGLPAAAFEVEIAPPPRNR